MPSLSQQDEHDKGYDHLHLDMGLGLDESKKRDDVAIDGSAPGNVVRQTGEGIQEAQGTHVTGTNPNRSIGSEGGGGGAPESYQYGSTQGTSTIDQYHHVQANDFSGQGHDRERYRIQDMAPAAAARSSRSIGTGTGTGTATQHTEDAASAHRRRQRRADAYAREHAAHAAEDAPW